MHMLSSIPALFALALAIISISASLPQDPGSGSSRAIHIHRRATLLRQMSLTLGRNVGQGGRSVYGPPTRSNTGTDSGLKKMADAFDAANQINDKTPKKFSNKVGKPTVKPDIPSSEKSNHILKALHNNL
ncbi:hypothetical protein H4R33_005270 [Dimargaris cristalligena]|nr:hypothetical protein H4R33_005270 [Dimargaris cristalligena]